MRTVVALLILPAGLGLAGASAVVLARLGAPRARIDRIYHGFARFAARVGGTRAEVRGLESVRRDAAYVVVSNHESNWDSVVLFALLPLPLRAVIKDELARIPVFGPALVATGCVRVGRRDTASDFASIDHEMSRRPTDVSMLFYAEGHRSRDGRLQPFKMGAFATAIDFGLPILPVAVAGTSEIWPPDTLRLRSGRCRLEVGAPIPVDGLTQDDRHALRERTRETVRELRARGRRELGLPPAD